MNTKKWSPVVLALMIGFAAGAICGKSYLKHDWKKHDRHHWMVEKFSKELHLTADQKARVEAIFEAKHPKMTALRDEMRPKFESIREETNVEIRKLLNPEQQKLLDQLNIKLEEKRKRWTSH